MLVRSSNKSAKNSRRWNKLVKLLSVLWGCQDILPLKVPLKKLTEFIQSIVHLLLKFHKWTLKRIDFIDFLCAIIKEKMSRSYPPPLPLPNKWYITQLGNWGTWATWVLEAPGCLDTYDTWRIEHLDIWATWEFNTLRHLKDTSVREYLRTLYFVDSSRHSFELLFCGKD